MTGRELIEFLQGDLDSEILIQVKRTKEENGFKHAVSEWVPLEEQHIMKPPFGGKQIFLGQK